MARRRIPEWMHPAPKQPVWMEKPTLKPSIKRRLLRNRVDRKTRKQALQIICSELRAETFEDRRAEIEHVYMMVSYVAEAADYSPPPVKQLDTWARNVCIRATELADLLEWLEEKLVEVRETLEYPAILHPKTLPAFISQLRELEEATNYQIYAGRGRKVSPLRDATASLVDGLDEIYTLATGKKGGAGRVHNHYGESGDEGKPSGPFFALVKAALALVGDTQGDEAILRAIRRHRARVRLEEATAARGTN